MFEVAVVVVVKVVAVVIICDFLNAGILWLLQS